LRIVAVALSRTRRRQLLNCGLAGGGLPGISPLIIDALPTSSSVVSRLKINPTFP